MNTDFDLFLTLCNYLGIISFAISGAFKGVKKRLDIFGVTLLAIITACGGGIIRDMIVGEIPGILKNPMGLYLSIMTSIIIFVFTTRIRRNIKISINKKHKIAKILVASNLLFDSIGLSVFSIVGAHKSVDLGMNIITSGILAALTGVGGGILRDILVAEVPSVLKEDIYAVLAFFVGILYHIFIVRLGFNQIIITIVLFSASLIIRLLVIKYKMNLPRTR